MLDLYTLSEFTVLYELYLKMLAQKWVPLNTCHTSSDTKRRNQPYSFCLMSIDVHKAYQSREYIVCILFIKIHKCNVEEFKIKGLVPQILGATGSVTIRVR